MTTYALRVAAVNTLYCIKQPRLCKCSFSAKCFLVQSVQLVQVNSAVLVQNAVLISNTLLVQSESLQACKTCNGIRLKYRHVKS